MSKQIVGWLLVTVGCLLIIWGLWSSYSIFTGKSPVPIVFSVPGLTSEQDGDGSVVVDPKNLSSSDIQKQIQKEIQDQMQLTVKEQFGKLLPPDMIPKTLNLFVWSLFMGILVFAGGRIAGIGTGLLKS